MGSETERYPSSGEGLTFYNSCAVGNSEPKCIRLLVISFIPCAITSFTQVGSEEEETNDPVSPKYRPKSGASRH